MRILSYAHGGNLHDIVTKMLRWMVGDGLLEVIDSFVTGQLGPQCQSRVGGTFGASGQAAVTGQLGLQTR